MANLQDLLPLTNNLSLLYIDKNDTNRTFMSKSLEKIFKYIDYSEDGYDALNQFRINTHDIIIVDIDVPSSSGIQLIKNIKSHNPNQKIILTTKTILQDDMVELINLGIGSYLVKPFTIDKLLDALDKLVNSFLLKTQNLDLSKKVNLIKKEHSLVLNKLDEQDKKSKETILYERKRIGKLLANQKVLEDELNECKNQSTGSKLVSELVPIANKNALQIDLKKHGNKALLYLNIDHFNLINKIYGMGVANRLLKEVTAKLKQLCSDFSTLYHITADEFAILLTENNISKAGELSTKIQNYFKNRSLNIANYTMDITFSIGMDEGNSLSIFVSSKAASQEARNFGGGKNIFYNSKSIYMESQRELLKWIKIVQDALINDRLIVHYQAVKSNDDSSILHYEVLSRIISDDNTYIDAKKFISPAKKAGIIPKITKIVIEKSFKHFRNNDFSFSINICKDDLYASYLKDYLIKHCETYYIKPERVYLELIENDKVEGGDVLFEYIKELRDAGFNIAVDDFGSDKSIFNHILNVKAKFIKIDSSFIDDLDSNESHKIVVENIVRFAKEVGIKCVAEKVETEEIYDIVRNLGVQYSQGYYISKPSKETN